MYFRSFVKKKEVNATLEAQKVDWPFAEVSVPAETVKGQI